MEAAVRLEIETVIEVRTEAELALALELGARTIGISSRDLETLEIDAAVPERLLGWFRECGCRRGERNCDARGCGSAREMGRGRGARGLRALGVVGSGNVR